MADHQFEQNVSQQMADFKLKPNAEVWQQVEKQLEEDRRRRRWFFYFPIAAVLIGVLLYAVWPTEEKTKPTEIAQTNTHATNKTKSTTIETNNNESPLTKTGSSTSANEITAAEKEVAENNLQRLTKTISQPQLNKSVKKPSGSKTKAKHKHGIVAKDQQTHREEVVVVSEIITEQKEALPGNPAIPVETTTIEKKFADSWVAEQPMLNDADSLVASTMNVETNTVASPSPAVNKKKWQLGLHANAGLSDIRGSLFPGSGFKSVSLADRFYSPGGSNNGGFGGATRIVQYEYAIKPSAHFGAGILLRKPFKKRHSFVTGLQYQTNSYTVTERQRIDSFINTTSMFSNISLKEKTEQFHMHTLNVPLELEFKIAGIGKGALLFNAGVHNWFVLASTQTDTLSAFRYAAESSRYTAYSSSTSKKETKATSYQPQLYLSPAYEWRSKKISSQLGLYLDYGLRRAYNTSTKDYWWQTGVRYRIFFQPKK